MDLEAIYVLKRDGVPFYVGKTVNKKFRLSQHKKRFGEDITLEEIEKVRKEVVPQAERFWIGFYKNKGYKLRNRAMTDLSKWRQRGDWSGFEQAYENMMMLKYFILHFNEDANYEDACIQYLKFNRKAQEVKREWDKLIKLAKPHLGDITEDLLKDSFSNDSYLSL